MIGNNQAFTNQEETMNYECITTRVEGEKVGIITLNRPKALNALNDQLMDELGHALKGFDADPAIGCMVITGSEKAFAAGADITAMAKFTFADAYKGDFITRNWETIRSIRKPVIAAVSGFALGGGCELAMMCDITVAADDALFGEPEIRFSNAGPAIVMPWFIGLKKARELLYLGDMIDATAALDLGMINKIVPAADLPVAGLKFAKRLSLISPEALYLTKLSINRGAEAAGFRSAVNVGVDVVSMLYAARTEMGAKFKEITLKEGLRAALNWRGNQFKE